MLGNYVSLIFFVALSLFICLLVINLPIVEDIDLQVRVTQKEIQTTVLNTFC